MPRSLLVVAAVLATVVAAACAPAFQVARYETNDTLYAASLEQYRAGKWDNAVLGFERLTLQLPARDTLLPRAHWYLGSAHLRRNEDLLAAQSFVRLVETFPGDTLADDALFEAARAYQSLWRKPALDEGYGETAIGTYQTLIAAYPQSPRRAEAEAEMARLQDWMARKDYETGVYYFRRRAYDSAIIYFQDVAERYPTTPTAKQASLRLLEVYRKIRYAEEAEQVCAALRTRYPDDAEVRGACGLAPATLPTPPPTRPDTGGAAR